MRQKYQDKLIASAKKDQIIPNEYNRPYTEWDYRIHQCARRVLAAVCFRENANNTYRRTGSIILPVIGYYYALFHMGVAILYLEYRTDLKKLKKIRHSYLINQIRDKLVNKKLIGERFPNLMTKLKEIREEANYYFGVIYNIEEMDYYVETGKAFDDAIHFIKVIDNTLKNYQQILMDIMIEIGDGFGDDITHTYLSEEDRESVDEYLLSKDLST